MSTHAVTRIDGHLEVCAGALHVHLVPMASDNLSWVLVCPATGACALIDGPEAGPALELIAARGWSLQAVLNTHTHGDHIGLNLDLARRGLLSGLRVFGRERGPGSVPGLTHPVGQGDRVQMGGVDVHGVTLGRVNGDVWLTEGHLDGHVSFLFGDALFCGDTLFAGGCGRIFDGPPRKMFDSLQRFAALPGGTRVFCAHEYTQDNLRFAWSVEPDNEALAGRIHKVWARRARGESAVPSTIEGERATNPFMRAHSATLRHHVAEQTGVAVDAPDADIFAAARALKDRGAYRARGDADLPLG